MKPLAPLLVVSSSLLPGLHSDGSQEEAAPDGGPKKQLGRKTSLHSLDSTVSWVPRGLGGVDLGTSSMNGKHRSYSRWLVSNVFFLKKYFHP